jgi:hypothetical protein
MSNLLIGLPDLLAASSSVSHIIPFCVTGLTPLRKEICHVFLAEIMMMISFFMSPSEVYSFYPATSS